MASSGYNPPLLEPKEEPLDDFLWMAGDNEAYAQSAAIMKEEVKEEPLDFVDSVPVENEIDNQHVIEIDYKKEEIIDDGEISNLVPISSSPVKNEPDEYIQDLIGFGLMKSHDKSAGNNALPKLSVESESKEADRDEVNSESGERELPSQSLMKKLTHMKNDIALECPEPRCLFRSKFVRVWIRHLKKKHSTTLIQAGLMLRCKCGNKSQTGAHILECNATNNCVVRVDQKISGELKCPECEFRTKSPRFWIDHLKSEHSTTPQLAGLALMCECGREALSHNHRTQCPIAIFSIIRKRDGPIRRLDDNVTTPQCILCDAHPRTAQKYASHLRIDHESTLMKNNIFVKCACGFEARTEAAFTNDQHSNKCDGYEFTVQKVDKTTPQCVLCDLYPRTPYAYASHIQEVHKTTMIRENIYLICSCGTEVRTASHNPEHNKECDGRKFSLHKVEDKIHSAPKCILCEAYPSTAYAYPEHLKKQHKSTLAANGLFIRCACGLSIRSSHRDSVHSKSGTCDGRIFTLHELDMRVPEPTAAHLSTSEEEMRTISNGSLLEPKQEPIDYSMSVENGIPQHLFKGVDNCKKEELVDDEEVLNLPPPSSPVKDESVVDEYVQNSNLVLIPSSTVKNEPDEYIQDLVGLGLIPAWDAALDQSARYGIQPVVVEESIGKVKEEVDFSVEQPLLAVCTVDRRTMPKEAQCCSYSIGGRKSESVGDSEPAVKKSRPNSKEANGIRDGYEFIAHSVDKKTPQCILCEVHPGTAHGYASHLSYKHKSTLKKNGFYLRCACGFEIRNSYPDLCHNQCDGRTFTLRKLDEK